MRIIGQAHTLLHANGVVRIQSDIRVGSRTDKKQSPADKVAKVEALLAADGKDEGEGKKGGQMTKKDGRYVMEEEGKHYVTMFVVCERVDEGEEARVMEVDKCEGWEWSTWEELVRLVRREQEVKEGEVLERRLFQPLVDLVVQRPGVVPTL